MTSSSASAVSFAARAGGSVVHKVRSAVGRPAAAPAGASGPLSGWLVVTVLCAPTDIDPGDPPAPLGELGEQIEVRVRPAPGGKGTELAARLRDRPSSGGAPGRLSGTDPQADLRSALRRAKQLVEVGEVLVVDPAPHGERTATPGGLLVEAWTKAAPQAGVR